MKNNARKIVADEMKKLKTSIGITVVVREIKGRRKTTPNTGVLESIDPYNGIKISNAKSTSLIPFIGLGIGIVEISNKDTKEILYSNPSLKFTDSDDYHERIAIANKLRKEKYGTEKHDISA